MREKELCPGSRICNDDPREHSDECSITKLHSCMSSAAGLLLDRALTTDFALEKGFHTDLDEVPADEFNVMRLLQAEKNKYEQEQSEKAKHHVQR